MLPCGPTWAWQDGSTSTYAHWNDGEPNCSSGNEACATIDPNSSFSWNAYTCLATLPGICSTKGTNDCNHLTYYVISNISIILS